MFRKGFRLLSAAAECDLQVQGYNDGLTSQPQEDEYAAPRLSPELAAREDFEDFERETVTKQIFEEGLGLAGVALLKQVAHFSPPEAPPRHSCDMMLLSLQGRDCFVDVLIFVQRS